MGRDPALADELESCEPCFRVALESDDGVVDPGDTFALNLAVECGLGCAAPNDFRIVQLPRGVEVLSRSVGPRVTRFELQAGPGPVRTPLRLAEDTLGAEILVRLPR